MSEVGRPAEIDSEEEQNRCTGSLIMAKMRFEIVCEYIGGFEISSYNGVY